MENGREAEGVLMEEEKERVWEWESKTKQTNPLSTGNPKK